MEEDSHATYLSYRGQQGSQQRNRSSGPRFDWYSRKHPDEPRNTCCFRQSGGVTSSRACRGSADTSFRAHDRGQPPHYPFLARPRHIEQSLLVERLWPPCQFLGCSRLYRHPAHSSEFKDVKPRSKNARSALILAIPRPGHEEHPRPAWRHRSESPRDQRAIGPEPDRCRRGFNGCSDGKYVTGRAGDRSHRPHKRNGSRYGRATDQSGCAAFRAWQRWC